MAYNSRYNKNGFSFDRKGNIRRENFSNSIKSDHKERDPAAEDRRNRREVIKDIEELVNSGVTLEDACRKMAEEHKDKFSYLPENALPQIFSGWYNGRVREKREIEKGKY